MNANQHVSTQHGSNADVSTVHARPLPAVRTRTRGYEAAHTADAAMDVIHFGGMLCSGIVCSIGLFKTDESMQTRMLPTCAYSRMVLSNGIVRSLPLSC